MVSAPRIMAQQVTAASALSDSAVAWQLGYQKMESTAFVLGLVLPGLGHAYAGEWWRGYLFLLAGGGGLAEGAVMYQWPRCGFDFLSGTDCSVSPAARVMGGVMVTASLAVWAMSAADAKEAVDRGRARRANDARRRRDAMSPIIVPCGVAARSLCVGVSMPAL